MKSYEEVVSVLAQKKYNSIMGGGQGQLPETNLVAYIYGKETAEVTKDINFVANKKMK
jgi:hypothetical protein